MTCKYFDMKLATDLNFSNKHIMALKDNCTHLEYSVHSLTLILSPDLHWLGGLPLTTWWHPQA